MPIARCAHWDVPPSERPAVMEKRFTLKDFFLFAAIGAVLVALLVAMYMIDRQWMMMSRMRATMQEQAEDLRALRNDLKALDRRVESEALAAPRGAASQAALATAPQPAPAAGSPATPAVAPVFERALAAARLPGYAPGDWLVRAFGVGLSTITPPRLPGCLRLERAELRAGVPALAQPPTRWNGRGSSRGRGRSARMASPSPSGCATG